MTATPASTAFTPVLAVRLAYDAAAAAGLTAGTPELIRLGSNAVLRLSGGVVARIGRDESWHAVAEREVRVAGALYDVGVPCVRPWPVSQPILVDGHPVTFWAEIPGPRRRAPIADLGAVLRLLHAVNGTALRQPLTPLDPWSHTPGRIEQAPIRDRDRRVLRDVLDEVQDAWPLAEFDLPDGVIHGDAHAGNLIQDPGGAPVLLDFDSVCSGPREWDLAPTGLYAVTLGWISRSDYAGFVDAYGGFDITAAAAFPLLARMRELRMTAWLAMHATESERLAAEVEHRVACLADPQLPRRWSAR